MAVKARLASPANEQKTQESIKLVIGGAMRKRGYEKEGGGRDMALGKEIQRGNGRNLTEEQEGT